MKRRDFLKGALAGGATLYVSLGPLAYRDGNQAWAVQKTNIGELKSVKIRCISETGWWSTPKLIKDIMASGGVKTSQYDIKWTERNEGAYAALIEAEELDGKIHRILLDTGWNIPYTDWCFQREGIGDLLKKDKIDFLYVTHEHLDHLWGMPVTCKYNPEVKLLIPDTFTPRGKEFIKKSGYKGKITELAAGNAHKLFPGCASVTFDIPILIGVRGEQVLLFNVKDKGILIVTGCCHPKINNIINWVNENVDLGKGFYGLYGGLHIALMEKWNPKFDVMIDSIAKAKFEKIGSNHCTGYVAVTKMLERKLAVAKGTGNYGTKSELYIGNGDTITFASAGAENVG